MVESLGFCNFAVEMKYSVRVHNQMLDLSHHVVMAIVNITPDSFYTSCRSMREDEVLRCAEKAIEEGADMLDLGACSTRPGSAPVDAEGEWARLEPALKAIRKRCPDAVISVDTFRAEVARRSIEAGADIINDVYGGEADNEMFDVLSKYRVPYILTHARTIPMSEDGYDRTMSDILDFLQSRTDELHRRGVADVILDPGFGFGKNVEQNYSLLRQLDVLQTLHAPILVGVSHKSMFYRPMGLTPDDVLPATIAAHMIALEKGASILRVHEVAPAKQAIAVYQYTYPKKD